MNYTVVLIPSAMRTRVLLSHGADELMRALLPPPSQVRHGRAGITFLEAMALWLDGDRLHTHLLGGEAARAWSSAVSTTIDDPARTAAPPPSRFSAHILPPWAAMIVRQMASPSPTPPPAARPRTNLSKMRSSSPGGMPGPRSASSTVTV